MGRVYHSTGDNDDDTKHSESNTASKITDKQQLQKITDLFNGNYDESDFEGFPASDANDSIDSNTGI